LQKGTLLWRDLTILLLLFIAFPAVAQEEGKTIWGENKKETLKTMREVSKALGVNCTHCHVKEGGKVVYETNTPNKEIARKMKLNFVDQLAAKGMLEVEYPHDGKTVKIKAVYTAKGEAAGIGLTATTGDGKVHQTRVQLPAEGEALSCLTCHNNQLHFLTHPEEQKKENK
jgi:hypothetical protein